MLTRSTLLAYFSCLATSFGLFTNAYAAEELPALSVMAQETANQRPATTYETPISNLEFDPRVDMQVRNMTEAQGDLTIRGGTFENTGVQVGSATLLDPQTGHYTTELPIAPEMLSEPKILTGSDNALRGFNSNTGTVSYSWSKITPGGSLTIGGGDHNLNFQRIHHALTGAYGDSKDWTWGAEIEGSRSESDGTIPYGDHAFDRTSGRIQLLGPDSQTDLFAGYQDKLYGWPAMYTANLANHEYEDLITRLFYLNHLQNYGNESSWEISSYYRRNYDLYKNRTSGYVGDHETKVSAVALLGRHEINQDVYINYGANIVGDKIDSIPLGNKFVSRNYYKLSILPEYISETNDGKTVTYQLGASWDDSNRDDSKISLISKIGVSKINKSGLKDEFYLSFSESSQVAGYGAIGGTASNPYFVGYTNLNRGVSKNLELGYSSNHENWKLSSAIFNRWDQDIFDWVYKSDLTRKVNHADIDTFGIETIASFSFEKIETILSYSYFKKDADYGRPDIVGSFYALNYPEHRATLGLIWNIIDSLEVRFDNEWREQYQNPLRTGPDSAFNSHLAASYYPAIFNDLELFLAYDKPWDEDFQDIPGTPGRGDQFSFGATYSW